MNWVRHGSSATFETKSSYCRVARQGLPCYTAVEQLGFKRRAVAGLKSNSIRSIEFGTAVARRLKRALESWQALLRCITDNAVTRSRFTNRQMYGNYCSIDPWEKTGGWISVVGLRLLVVTKGLNWKGSSSYAVFSIKNLNSKFTNPPYILTFTGHTNHWSFCRSPFSSEIGVYGPSSVPRSQIEDQV